MALVFQGTSAASVNWGLISKIEVSAVGGSYQDVGYIAGSADGTIVPITKRGDPADTDIVIALRMNFSFRGLQTAKLKELTNMAGTSGTGLFDTDCYVKFTFIGPARTMIFGALSGYPLRIVPEFHPGDGGSPSYITYTGTHVEPYTTGAAGKFSA